MDLDLGRSSSSGNTLTHHIPAETDINMTNLAQTTSEQLQQEANGDPTHRTTTKMTIPPKKTKTAGLIQDRQLPRRRKSLSTLLTMPLDILFEVLGHLAPKDLSNLTRTTKALRTILLNKSATSVWKTSRKCLGGPDPPTGMPEHAWAILIFTTTCTSCGVSNAQTVDFLLRRRMCKKCKQQNLIISANILNHFPGMDLAILDLVAPNFDGNSYWRHDIDRVLKTMAAYDARIIGGDEAAAAESAKYKEGRIQIVKDMRQDVIRLNLWMEGVTRQKLQLKEASLLQQKIKMATDHFHSLGYLDEDMPNLSLEREITRSGKMTKQGWNRLCERAEPSYFKNKELRREREDRTVRLSRRHMADKAYRSYAMTIPPSQWKYLPSAEVACALQPFRNLITADANVKVTEASFAACTDDLSRALEAARLDMKRRNILVSPPLFPGQDLSDASMQKAFAMLELVKNPFQCFVNDGQCDEVLYGWDDIFSHHCLMSDIDTPPDAFNTGFFDEYSPRFLEGFPNWSRHYRGMTVYASYVARVTGFQAASATVAQMDSSDLRYTCSLCNKSSTKAVAYTWRGCAEHLNRRHVDLEAKFQDLMRLKPTTRRAGDDIVTTLSQADTDWVKEKERELEHGPDSKWACTHCPTHLTHSVPYADVVQHVKDAHDIDYPKEVVDLIPLRRVRRGYAIYYEPAPQFS